MADDALLQRCRSVAGFADDAVCDGESLIGILQRFRPDGEGLEGLFDGLPMGAALRGRLRQLYVVAGDTTRPGGGQDAYFIVRNPPVLDPQRASTLVSQWLQDLLNLAQETSFSEFKLCLDPLPQVRVLEGVAPKQNKANLENFPLYRAIKQEAAQMSERLAPAHPMLDLLRPAYYFAACDWALRDYLLWPIYAEFSRVNDPFRAYFELWRHGVKLRAFNNDCIDVYLPRIE